VLVETIEKNRFIILLATLPLFIVAALGVTRLELNPNNRAFFSEDSERFRDLVSLEQEFELGSSLVFVAHSDKKLTESANLVAAVRSLTDYAWRLPYVVGVSSLENVATSLSTDDSVLLGNILDSICPNSEECAGVVGIAPLMKPHILNRYVSDDLQSAAIFVELDVPKDAVNAIVEAVHVARDVAQQTEGLYDVDVSLTGAVPMMYAFIDASSKDLSRLLPVAFLLMLFLLAAILRSVALTFLAFLSAIFVSIVTAGLLGWFVGTVNTATSSLPIIVGTLYLATSLHFYMPLLRSGSARERSEVRRLVSTTLNSCSSPILLANITTAIGLLAMLYVESPPIKQLGVFCGIGVLVGTIVLLVINPAILFSFRSIKASRASVLIHGVGNAIANSIDKGRMATLSVLLPFLVLSAGISKINIDEDFLHYFSETSEFREQTEKIGRTLFGPYRIDLVLDSGTEHGVFETEFVRDLKSYTEWARSQSQVASVVSLIDVLEEAQQTFGVPASVEDMAPEARAQLYASYELSLSFGQGSRKLVNPHQQIIRVSMLMGQMSMSEIRSFEQDLLDRAEAEFGDLVQVVASGEGIPTAWLAKDTIMDGLVSLLASFLMCSVCVWFVFRSRRMALLSGLTAAFPIVCGFGFWGWLGQPLGIAAVLVVAMTIGIVIDDAIHLVYRYVRATESGETLESGSVAYSLHKTAPAMIATTIVLSGGYAVLMFSSFEMNVVFGALASLIVVLATTYNLFVTPQLLMRLGFRGEVSAMVSDGSHTARSQ